MQTRSALACLLAAAVTVASAPARAYAQLARAAAAPAVAPVAAPAVVVSPSPLAPLSMSQLPLGGVSVRLNASLPTPALTPTPAPTAKAIPVVAAAASAKAAPPKAEPLLAHVARLQAAAAKDLAVLPTASAGQSHAAAEQGFARIAGIELSGRAAAQAETVVAPAPVRALRSPLGRANASVEAPAPETPAPQGPAKGDVRWYLAGTGLFKVGMEALGLAVPLIALTVFGQAAWAAAMAMGWGLSQIIGSSVGGGILDRRPPAKVLSWTMRLQAASVGVLLAAFAAQSFLGLPLAQPLVVFALHVTTGVLAGVADTARQVIPPALVGNDGQDLKVFNSKVHVAYEVAGVAGALLTGVLIAKLGIVPALLLHPPAYLLAAFAFSRLKLAPALKAAPPAGSALGRAKEAVARALADLKEGFRAVKGSKVVFWAAVALVLPLLLHRILESLLIPVAAKTLLADPSVAAWIIAASNFGELLGAVALMRANRSDEAAAKLRSPFWIRLMAAGILGLWTLTFAPSLWFILPAVAFGSLTWAASDLSLRSKIQQTLPPEVRGRTFGFLTAAAFGLVLLSSFGLGFLFDALGGGPVFWGVNAVLTVMALGLFYAARKLATTYPSPK